MHSIWGVVGLMGITVRWLVLICMLLSVQATYGQEEETTQQTNEKIQELASLGRPPSADVPLGAGDLIHIEVFDVPELSRDVRISASGELGFPPIPERVRAAGLTPFELEDKLQQLLRQSGLVSHPEVSVFVKEQISQPLTIMGAVTRSMTYQAVRPTTLLELVANAGGITDNAGTVIWITRPTRREAVKPAADSTNGSPDSDEQTITIRLQDLLGPENATFNILLQGGDVVNIPPAGLVYVLGRGITQPGGYVLQSRGEQVTVLKALALARGLASFAKPDDAVIYRTNPKTGKREAIPAHIKQIEKNKSEDVALKANDILYVPDNLGLRVAARAVEAAVSIGTGILVYRSGNP
jgi:polysaccharide export outer membrane protein